MQIATHLREIQTTVPTNCVQAACVLCVVCNGRSGVVISTTNMSGFEIIALFFILMPNRVRNKNSS
jgi:hypothetical protein